MCNKEEPETNRFLADVYRQQAECEIQQKRSAKDSIAKGFEWIEKSLKMVGENSDAIAIQGALFLFQARTETNPAERDKYAGSAVTALEKALKLNPLLRNEYEPVRKDARAI